MATAAAKYYIPERRTEGNLARRYSDTYGNTVPAPQHIPAPKPVTAPPVRRERERARPAREEVKGVSISTLICFAAAISLLFVLLSGYVNMIELSDSSVSLREELSRLEQEKMILKAKYESVIDLKEIERYAIYELGMVVPGADSVMYVDLSEPDKVVLGGGNESSGGSDIEGVIAPAQGFAYLIVEYFR